MAKGNKKGEVHNFWASIIKSDDSQNEDKETIDAANTDTSGNGLPKYNFDRIGDYSLDQLRKKRYLDLNNKRLTYEQLEFIGNLTQLITLDLSNTNISALPESFGNLTKLSSLDLSNTNISTLPKNSSLKNIICENLDNLHIPIELIKRSPQFIADISYTEYSGTASGLQIFVKGSALADSGLLDLIEAGASSNLILEYYESNALEDNVETLLRENKIIFLGDSNVGKSTIIRRIRKNNKKLTPQEIDEIERTPGVAIEAIQMTNHGEIIADKTFFSKNNHTIKFWDFGGDQILYSMHRCFLTKNSIYVVVVCGRTNDMKYKVRFWLDNIKDFARDSRVMVVISQTDQYEGEYIDTYGLCEDYKNFDIEIVSFLRLSAYEDEPTAFSRLSNKIFELIKDTGKKYPANWINARRKLDYMADNYINDKEYINICKSYRITHTVDFLDMLKHLGVVFTTREKTAPFEPNYKVLKPIWLVNAIYAIIDNGQNKFKSRNGVLLIKDIVKLLLENATFANPKYSNTTYEDDTEVQYILIVMQQHMLSLKIDAEQEFIPALCQPQTPTEVQSLEKSTTLKYRMDYNNLPENVLHRLMIRFKNHINFNCLWSDGVLFNDISDCDALIERKKEGALAKGSLHIFIQRRPEIDDALMKNCLRKICEKLYEINEGLGISAKDFIIYEEEIDGKKLSGEVDYETLLKQYRKGGSESWVGGEIDDYIPIDKILKYAKTDLENDVITATNGRYDQDTVPLEPIIKALEKQADSNQNIAKLLTKIYDILAQGNVNERKKRSQILESVIKTAPTIIKLLPEIIERFSN